jgi:AAHS family 4-hydroxybenzoate transporter-like MFS transporter
MSTVDVVPIIERQKAGRFWFVLFSVSLLITFLDGFDFQVLSFAGTPVKKAFHLTDTQLGTLGTIGLLGTLVGGLVLGYVADRVGRRPSIIVATLGFAIFMLALALAQDYTQLITLRFVSGFFLGGVLPLTWALNTEFAPVRHRSMSVALIMVGYTLGGAAGGPMCNVLIPDHGWQSVFVAGGVVSLLALVPVVFLLPESVKFLAHRPGNDHRIARILRRAQPGLTLPEDVHFVVGEPTVRGRFTPADLFSGRLAQITPLLWGIYICSSALIYFVAFWSPTINERIGFTASAAATIAAVASVLGAVAQLVIGRFIDRMGAATTAWMPLLAIPCLLLIGLGSLAPAGYIAAILASKMFINGGHGGINSVTGIFYPTTIRANGAGWASSIAKLGAMLGPWLAGVLLDAGYRPFDLFTVFAVCPAIMVVLLLALGRAQRSLPAGAEGGMIAAGGRVPVADEESAFSH